MADMPEGVELIDNPVSVAPGFRIENVYVLPGVPKIMQAMLDRLLPKLEGGVKVLARADHRLCARGRRRGSASAKIQARFPDARDRQLSVLPARRARAPRSCSAAPIRRRSTGRPKPSTRSPPGLAPPSGKSIPADLGWPS